MMQSHRKQIARTLREKRRSQVLILIQHFGFIDANIDSGHHFVGRWNPDMIGMAWPISDVYSSHSAVTELGINTVLSASMDPRATPKHSDRLKVGRFAMEPLEQSVTISTHRRNIVKMCSVTDSVTGWPGLVDRARPERVGSVGIGTGRTGSDWRSAGD